MKKYALLSSLLLMYVGSAFSAPINLNGNISVSSDVTKTGDENAYQSDGTGFSFRNDKSVSVENGYGILAIIGDDNVLSSIVVGNGTRVIEGAVLVTFLETAAESSDHITLSIENVYSAVVVIYGIHKSVIIGSS